MFSIKSITFYVYLLFVYLGVIVPILGLINIYIGYKIHDVHGFSLPFEFVRYFNYEIVLSYSLTGFLSLLLVILSIKGITSKNLPKFLILFLTILVIRYITPFFTNTSIGLIPKNFHIWLLPLDLLNILPIIILVMERNKLNNKASKISELGKYTISILCLPIIFLAGILITTFAFTKIINPSDFWYKLSSSRVNFSLYKPKYIPEGYIIESKYLNNTSFITENTAVTLTLNTPISAWKDQNHTKLIVVKQDAKPIDFNINEYSKSKYPSFKQIPNQIGNENYKEVIQLVNDKNIPDKTDIVFVTTVDNTLIQIVAFNAGSEEIVRLATSFTK